MLSGGEGAWRSLKPTQGDAAMERWQKRDQGGPGLYCHEARLFKKCCRTSCTALGAVTAFVVEFADFVVSVAHRMRMTGCRFMRLNMRCMGHCMRCFTLSGMTKRLTGSRKPLHRECKDEPANSQDAQNFHKADATSVHPASAIKVSASSVGQ